MFGWVTVGGGAALVGVVAGGGGAAVAGVVAVELLTGFTPKVVVVWAFSW